jgi:transposase
MTGRSTNVASSTTTKTLPPPIFADSGKQTEAMLKAQKAVLETYEHIGRAWLSRAQSEMDLWSGLSAKLAATRSFPEAVGVCQEYVSQRIRMIAEDGQRLSEDSQEIMNKITGSLSNIGKT